MIGNPIKTLSPSVSFIDFTPAVFLPIAAISLVSNLIDKPFCVTIKNSSSLANTTFAIESPSFNFIAIMPVVFFTDLYSSIDVFLNCPFLVINLTYL